MSPFHFYPRLPPLWIRLKPPKITLRTFSALRKPPRATPPLPTPSQPPDHVPPSPRRPFLHKSLSLLTTFSAICAGCAFIHTHVFAISSVTGTSMYPFLNTNHSRTLSLEHLLLNCWNPSSNLHRGSIIAFYTPHDPERLALKRVVALEGDGVITKDTYPVPVGHVWVEGDGGEEGLSYDSNYYGPVSKGLVVGKVVGVVWPFERAGWVRWEDCRGSDRVVEGKAVVQKIEFY